MAINNNTPPVSDYSNSSGGVGMIIGVVAVIAIIALFFLYGLPALRKSQNNDTNINVPDKIQIDVNNQ